MHETPSLGRGIETSLCYGIGDSLVVISKQSIQCAVSAKSGTDAFTSWPSCTIDQPHCLHRAALPGVLAEEMFRLGNISTLVLE